MLLSQHEQSRCQQYVADPHVMVADISEMVIHDDLRRLADS